MCSTLQMLLQLWIPYRTYEKPAFRVGSLLPDGHEKRTTGPPASVHIRITRHDTTHLPRVVEIKIWERCRFREETVGGYREELT